ncbi:xanthine dehydrogenase subunit D [Salsuginibacillus kocurii]|uniref:xanthine dehydrogenase subunit D n=1 Tax=Salsuginibacillus kocurii TaxID=427078 RepID=UPI00037C0A18|nr:xanthine dehydrogenase subunit D [Salsuginibacillus kocurii]
MEAKSPLTAQTTSIRPDGVEKVTGQLSYLTDLSFSATLYGKVLRSAFPHAKVLSLCTKEAENLPGVHAVLTAKDVPGVNGYGIIEPDQPVFCEDRVRSVGDALAAVAADSKEIAERALRLIKVEYEELPVLDTPEKSLQEGAPLLHEKGNQLHERTHANGDIEAGFAAAAVIEEETYQLPRQMHAYMETEGGTVVPEADGGITVYMGTQHGFKDRFQLARLLNMDEDNIRVVSSPMGGSFGGKDELNVQPYAALLALKTKRPVKIHQSREESVKAGLKRHPMKITMKTGADQDGNLLAHQVEIVADTGAYSTLGPAILDFAVEHAAGLYIIPHLKIHGLSVFTNNGVAGEFRGFGGNQITFALEGQMDRLAKKLALDPLEFRRRNVRAATDPGPLGHRIAPHPGAELVVEEVEKMRTEVKKEQASPQEPWVKTGIGTAICMHGGGLGYNRLDSAGGQLALSEDGRLEISFGFEEVGQGIVSVIETLMIDTFSCAKEDIKTVIGDTEVVPKTGSTTASRGTSMVWHALERMKGPFTLQLLERVSKRTGQSTDAMLLAKNGVYVRAEEGAPHYIYSYKELAQQEPGEDPIVVTTEFEFPTTPDPVDGGHFLYTFSSVLAAVQVNLLTGQVKVTSLDQAVAAGPVVSRLGYLGQIEGGSGMALGYTLMEDAVMEEGEYQTVNFDSYLIPGIGDMPASIEVEAVETLAEGDSYGPRGVGEIGTVAVAPAITKAIHDACGVWVSKLPVSRETIIESANKGGAPKWLSTSKV